MRPGRLRPPRAHRTAEALALAIADALLSAREGVWRIGTVIPGSSRLTITQAPEDDDRNYSDEAVLVGDIRWVVHGKSVAR